MAWYAPWTWNWTGGQTGKDLQSKGEHYDLASGFLKDRLGAVDQRQAPSVFGQQLGGAAQLNGAREADARMQMQGVANRLGAIASGQQAGAGELAVNRQVGQATAAQQAAARMARGANAALAARNAARNTADLGVAGAGQAAIAQLNDQTQANQLLGGILSGMRGQDIDVAGQNANLLQQRNFLQGQLNQQAGLANQDARLRQMGMNDAAAQGYLAQLLGLDQRTFQNEAMKQGLMASDKGILGNAMGIGGQALAAYAGGG